MQLVVEASNLMKRFGTVQAVNGVNISVSEGETVALLGPNGAGKTTTLLMLLGAIRPDSGSIAIMGEPVPKHRAQAMQHVGFAAGYLPLPERLTVKESLSFFARLYGIRKPVPVIESVLERLEVAHLMNAGTDTLSSGQRTLVGIAKAIMHKPKLLVLDEPTASLDPDVADRVRTAIASLNTQDGVTLLITSHDMPEVVELCERVLFIQNGQLIADGEPDELVAHYDQEDLTGVFLHVAREVVDINLGNTMPTRGK